MGTKSMIVFDPHPDDADWWTGALSMLLLAKGWEVHYVCVGPTNKTTREMADKSAAILGVKRHYLEIPIRDNPNLRGELIEKLPAAIKDFGAQMMFIPSDVDYHQEHVDVSRELFHILSCPPVPLGKFELYHYDSHENRNLVEIYIDVVSVWEKHMESLRVFSIFHSKGLPEGENTLTRLKTGRAMMLGTSHPISPVLYVEGYRLLRGNPKTITTLKEELPEQFSYRCDRALKLM